MDVHATSACLLLLVTSLVLCQQQKCPSSSASSGVHFWASSYRNTTGHWITQAAVTRRSSGEVVGPRSEEKTLEYAVDIARVHCAEQDSLTTTFHIAVPPPRVGADYTIFPGIGYYKLHTKKLNWENARKTCSAERAHLAIINSAAEENAIRELMQKYSKDNFTAFVGFTDSYWEGRYLTLFGYLIDTTGHVRWTTSELNKVVDPGSAEDEDCGTIDLSGAINDAQCSLELPFVCEQSF